MDFIFIDLLEWMVSKCQKSVKKEQFRSWPYRKHTISKQLGVIIFERPGDAEELFPIEYEDGDEEDMNTQEVTEAIALAAARREAGW